MDKLSTPPIIIIGMHRSGTSMLSRLLEKAGVFMGKNKDINNESLFFLNFNKWIFSQANATWDNIYNFQFITDEFKDAMEYFARLYLKSLKVKNYLGIKNFIKYKTIFNLDYPWGWKDPRNTFTLDIWLRIFPNAKILHIYRHPIDVAESLKNRSKKKFIPNLGRREKLKVFLHGYILYKYCVSIRVLSIKEAIELYKDYVNQAFFYSNLIKDNLLHIRYETLLKEPYYTMKDILDFLNISLTKHRLSEVIKDINVSRCFAFKRNKLLIDFNNNMIKNDQTYYKLLKKLDYINI